MEVAGDLDKGCLSGVVGMKADWSGLKEEWEERKVKKGFLTFNCDKIHKT